MGVADGAERVVSSTRIKKAAACIYCLSRDYRRKNLRLMILVTTHVFRAYALTAGHQLMHTIYIGWRIGKASVIDDIASAAGGGERLSAPRPT